MYVTIDAVIPNSFARIFPVLIGAGNSSQRSDDGEVIRTCQTYRRAPQRGGCLGKSSVQNRQRNTGLLSGAEPAVQLAEGVHAHRERRPSSAWNRRAALCTRPRELAFAARRGRHGRCARRKPPGRGIGAGWPRREAEHR